MKRVLLTVILLCSPAFAQWAYVQSAVASPSGTTANVTLTLTAANFVSVLVRSNTAGATFTVSTSKLDTVSTDATCKSAIGDDPDYQIFWISSAVGGSTVITMTATAASFVVIVAAEYSGGSGSPFDGCSVISVSSPSGTSVTTTVNNDLLVGISGYASGASGTPTATAGYTLRQSVTSGMTFFDGYWDNTNTNTAGVQTFAANYGSLSGVETGLAAFKPSGAGGSSASQIGVFAVGP